MKQAVASGDGAGAKIDRRISYRAILEQPNDDVEALRPMLQSPSNDDHRRLAGNGGLRAQSYMAPYDIKRVSRLFFPVPRPYQPPASPEQGEEHEQERWPAPGEGLLPLKGKGDLGGGEDGKSRATIEMLEWARTPTQSANHPSRQYSQSSEEDMGGGSGTMPPSYHTSPRHSPSPDSMRARRESGTLPEDVPLPSSPTRK